MVIIIMQIQHQHNKQVSTQLSVVDWNKTLFMWKHTNNQIVDVLKPSVVLRRLMYFTGRPEADMGNQCSAEKGISSAIFCWLALTQEIDFSPFVLSSLFNSTFTFQILEGLNGQAAVSGWWDVSVESVRLGPLGAPGSFTGSERADYRDEAVTVPCSIPLVCM